MAGILLNLLVGEYFGEAESNKIIFSREIGRTILHFGVENTINLPDKMPNSGIFGKFQFSQW